MQKKGVWRVAKKLKNVLVNSVDLCKQGANQRAFICLKKSVEEGNSVSDIKTSIIQIGRAHV